MLVRDVIEYLQKCNPQATAVFATDDDQSVIECVEHNIRANTVCFHSKMPNWRFSDKEAGIETQVLFLETTYTEL